MGALGAMFAVVLPAVWGALCVKWAMRDDRPGAWAIAVGYGYLVGFVVVSALLGVQGSMLGSLSPWAVFVLVFLGVVGVWLRGLSDSEREAVMGTSLIVSLRAWPMLALIVLGWLVVRGASLAYELFDQGLYAWDAWSTWAYRARVWVETGEWIIFVPPDVWLAEREAGLATLIAPHYPKLVSLIAAWPALAMGEWSERAANLPWLGLWIALGFAVYGQARGWGASILASMITTWLLLSLPLVGSQVALAGYADLWLAAALGLGFMAFLRWARDHDPRQGGLAALCVVIAVFVKAEGLVWAFFFVPALGALYLRQRGWLVAGVIAVVGVSALQLTGGLSVTLPGLGPVEVSLDRIATGRTGVFEFSAQDGVLQPLLTHLFVFGTWHLLATLLVLALGVTLVSFVREDRGLLAATWQRAALAWVLAAIIAFYVLFFWTSAAEWVRLGTSGNRIMLHFAPALIFWFLTLWVALTAGQAKPADSSG